MSDASPILPDQAELVRKKSRQKEPLKVRFYKRNHDIIGRIQVGQYLLKRKSGFWDLITNISGVIGAFFLPDPFAKLALFGVNLPIWVGRVAIPVYVGGLVGIFKFLIPLLLGMFRARRTGLIAKPNEQIREVSKQYRAAKEADPNVRVVELGKKDPLQIAIIDQRVSTFFWNSANDLAIQRMRKAFSSPPINGINPEDIIVAKCSEEFRNGHFIYNESKIRLATDLSTIELKDQATVTLQRTTYFDSLFGNENISRTTFFEEPPSDDQVKRAESLGCKLVFLGKEFENVFTEVSREVPLSVENDISHHFGVNILAFNKRMGFILQVQGAANLFDSGKLAPTGSGSSDWYRKLNLELTTIALPVSTVQNSGSFRDLLESEAIRELQEESRLSLRPVDKRNIEITGYSRSLERALKPDFFMFLYLADNYKDSEAAIIKRVRRGKELLFVDDIVIDLFAFAFKWPDEFEHAYRNGTATDRQTIKVKMREYVTALVQSGADKAYDHLVDELKYDGYIKPEDLAILLRKAEGKDRPREYWCLLLKFMIRIPKSGSGLRVTAACLLNRIERDEEFAKQFDPGENVSSEENYSLPLADPSSD